MFSHWKSYVFLLDHIGEDEEGQGISLQPRYPWEESDRDYDYEEVYYLLLFCLNSLLKFKLSLVMHHRFHIQCIFHLFYFLLLVFLFVNSVVAWMT